MLIVQFFKVFSLLLLAQNILATRLLQCFSLLTRSPSDGIFLNSMLFCIPTNSGSRYKVDFMIIIYNTMVQQLSFLPSYYQLLKCLNLFFSLPFLQKINTIMNAFSMLLAHLILLIFFP